MTQSYDSLGRPSASTTTINGVELQPVGDLRQRSAAAGDLQTYPSGFAVRNAYNARGYLASVAEDGGSHGLLAGR